MNQLSVFCLTNDFIQCEIHDLLGAPQAKDWVLFTSPMSWRVRSLSPEEFVDDGREIGEAEDRVVGVVSGKGHWLIVNVKSRK